MSRTPLRAMAALGAAMLLLTGCWNKYELPQLGFVMGVAIDPQENGRLFLTVQIYKPQPSGSEGQSGGDIAFINATASDDSIMEAVRDLPAEVGRKLQWSHMRVIVIGEEVLKTHEINDVLDFFYRDHEPRITASVMIAEGKAERYLRSKALLEQTTGQQLLREMESTQSMSAKTADSTLLSLGLQLRSEVGNAVVAYVHPLKSGDSQYATLGIAALKQGRLAAILNANRAEGLTMLLNKYRSGVLSIACPAARDGDGVIRGRESLEILELKTRLRPVVRNGSVIVHVTTRVDSALGSLKCTSLKNRDDEERLIQRAEAAIQAIMLKTIQELQKKRLDLLGIGNAVYAHDPARWSAWKPVWADKFAKAEFKLDVDINLLSTGTTAGAPIFAPPSEDSS